MNRSKPKPPHRMPIDPKPTLELFRLPYYRVHYKALEAYVKTVFGFDFDFLFAASTSQGIAVDYTVNGQLDSIAWERRAGDLRRGQRTRDVVLILNVLAHDGYIPRGQYTISTRKLPDPTNEYRALLQRIGDPQAPECIRFKQQHKSDKTFVGRAAILDKTFAEAK